MYPTEYNNTIAPMPVPIEANNKLRASTWKATANKPSHGINRRSRGVPPLIMGKAAITAARLGTQHSTARIPFALEESNFASNI
jgi:hypothetical protein